jgi:putative sigma-54 modulation protein
MQIIFTGKHLEMTPALRDYAEGKLQKLARFFDHVQDVQVTESIQRAQHIIEVTLNADGTLIRAEERSADMYTSVDLVVAKLERQLKKFKGRMITRSHESLGGSKPTELIPAPPETEAAAEGAEEEFVPAIVRTKRFAVKPMAPEEAALEMELVGHDFFVFRNSETDEVNVIYRRRDGNYGLIEPVL